MAVNIFITGASGFVGGAAALRSPAMVMARDCILIDTKAKTELGYRPRVNVEEGLAALKDGTTRRA
jgi:nucleoside-diphosphate-sugar epimerase